MSVAVGKIFSWLSFIWAVNGWFIIQFEEFAKWFLDQDMVIDQPTKIFYYGVCGFLVLVHCFRLAIKAYKEFKDVLKEHPLKKGKK